MHTIGQACERRRRAVICVCLTLTLTTPITAPAADELPQTSPDGLELQMDTKARVVYVKPGATLDQYKRVAILDCFVDFAKDWQRDFNRDRRAAGSRVTTQDMERIKADLAAEFRKIFTEELQDKGGYEVVDVAGPDVLILRPAIINLAITAPDLQSPDRSRTIVDSAGQMTLYLELYDSVTDTLLARAMDPQGDRRSFAQSANRATNKAAADRILRQWASALRAHLDAAHGKTPGQ